jgi:hypothetical protein
MDVYLPADLWGAFRRKKVTALGSRGTPYTRWVPINMPQLGPYKPLLDSVFYLYETKEDAEKADKSGGTGFLVIVPSEMNAGRGYVYGVTNWHNACQKTSVVRINCRNGPSEIFEFNPDEWEFIPNYHDIAVIGLPVRAAERHKVSYISTEQFLTEKQVQEMDIDVADDIFMIGRFIDYDGIETNKPAMRFGNISIMSAPIRQPNGFMGFSIVADMHSRTGFSGSPVFVYRTTGSYFDYADDDISKNSVRFGHIVKLLGIHWGQFPEAWEIAQMTPPEPHAALITDGRYVKGLSGMTCVIPAEAILEVLNMPKLRKYRAENDIIVAQHLAIIGAPVSETQS